MQRTSWRERDLRGDGPVPSSVGGVVHRTRLALFVARCGESALFGAAALLTTLAALTVGDVSLARIDTWIVALLSALACGLAWGLEHRRSAGDVAHELDRRLRHQGGLVTAYELEGERAETPMTRLLRGRVLARLRPGDALRAMLPPLPLPVAAPLVGAGLLALAIESRRAPEGPVTDLGALAQGLVAVIDGLESDVQDADAAGDEGVDTRTLRDVYDVVTRARGLQRRADQLATEPARAEHELEALDHDLASLSARLADEPALRDQLEDARNWVDAARMGLAAVTDSADAREGSGTGEGTAVTEAGGDGTMSAASGEGTLSPLRPGADPPDPADAEGAGDDSETARDSGTVAGSFWPPEYDGIVSGWIELLRNAPPPVTR
jgi:hypothetical protein